MSPENKVVLPKKIPILRIGEGIEIYYDYWHSDNTFALKVYDPTKRQDGPWFCLAVDYDNQRQITGLNGGRFFAWVDTEKATYSLMYQEDEKRPGIAVLTKVQEYQAGDILPSSSQRPQSELQAKLMEMGYPAQILYQETVAHYLTQSNLTPEMVRANPFIVPANV